MSIGTLKLMPWAPRMIAVLMPITRPRESTSGPPELPGLSATSLWMIPSMACPSLARIVRPSALTTPADTVELKPSGLPIATTSCPTRRLAELAEGRVRQGPTDGSHDREIGRVIDARRAAPRTSSRR